MGPAAEMPRAGRSYRPPERSGGAGGRRAELTRGKGEPDGTGHRRNGTGGPLHECIKGSLLPLGTIPSVIRVFLLAALFFVILDIVIRESIGL